jgi:hypothetical protein
VIVAPACGWESLLEKIASDAKFGGTNIRKLSFTNAEGCGRQICQFLTGVVGRHPTLRRTTAAGSGEGRALRHVAGMLRGVSVNE